MDRRNFPYLALIVASLGLLALILSSATNAPDCSDGHVAVRSNNLGYTWFCVRGYEP